MNFSLGEAILGTGIDLSGLRKGFDKAEGESQSSVQRIGASLKNALGIAAGAAALGIAAATAAVIGLGTAAFNAGVELDGAFDTILTKTGATGAQLTGLQDSFKTVFASVPTDAGNAANVIAELNRRLGLTGPVLEGASKSLLEMTRLLGGDATTNAGLFARVMGDWSIQNEDASATLDKIFTASQKTGVGVDSLMQKVVQFGSPMRLMGFTLDDAIALFGKWEKEGVNAELVMGSLRIAAGKFAADGKPLRESLLSTIKQIQTMTDSSKALALGMDVFGSRAGPDMVAAIREGRFAIDDLLKSLDESGGAIMTTAGQTADFGERLTIMGNKAKLALEPLGMKLLDVTSIVLDRFMPTFDRALPVVTGFMEGVGGAIDALLAGGDLGDAADAFVEFFSPFLAGGQADAIRSAAAGVQDLLNFVQTNGPGALAQLQPLADAAGNLAGAFGDSMPRIKQYVGDAFGFITQQGGIVGPQLIGNLAGALNALTSLWQQHGDTIMAVVNGAFRFITVTAGVSLTLLTGLVTAALQLLSGDWSGAWNTLVTTAQSVLNQILGIVGMDLNQFTQIWSDVFGMLGVILDDGWKKVIAWVSNGILSAIKAAQDIANGAGAIGTAFVDGIKAGIGAALAGLIAAAVGAVTSAVNAAKSALGIQSPSKVTAELIGEPYSTGIAEGILGGMPEIRAAVSTAAASTITDARSFHIDARGATMTRADIEGVVRRVMDEYGLSADSRRRLRTAS